MNENDDRLEISLLYQENVKIAAIFWEWRHKLITQFVTAMTAIMFVSAWFYERPSLRTWTFSPFLLGAILSMIFLLLEKLNNNVLRTCYKTGNDLEITFSPEGGIFKSFYGIQSSKLSYYKIISFVYIGCATIFISASIFAIVFIK
jgi:hypothetical protein